MNKIKEPLITRPVRSVVWKVGTGINPAPPIRLAVILDSRHLAFQVFEMNEESLNYQIANN